MITINNLSFSYDGQNEILKNINLEFSENAIHGIVGNNGEGKTTLFQCIIGLLKTYKGSICHTTGENIRMISGFLSTDIYFYPRITGREYLYFQQYAQKKTITKEEIQVWNSIFELPLDSYAENYSTGMKKKIALMSLILQKNKVLLLDEPFNGVDLISNLLLKEVFSRIKSYTTIILTSHILESLTSICDDIVYMKSGQIVKTYSPIDYLNIETDITKSFLESKIGIISRIV